MQHVSEMKGVKVNDYNCVTIRGVPYKYVEPAWNSLPTSNETLRDLRGVYIKTVTGKAPVKDRSRKGSPKRMNLSSWFDADTHVCT